MQPTKLIGPAGQLAELFARTVEDSAETQLNPQATHHLGAVHYDGSETPIGVNFFGLTFEDANYALVTDSGITLRRFERAVLGAMQRGKSCGMFAGKVWRYVGVTSAHQFSEQLPSVIESRSAHN